MHMQDNRAQAQSQSSQPKRLVAPVHFKPVPKTSRQQTNQDAATKTTRHQKPAVRLTQYSGSNAQQDQGSFLSSGSSGWQERGSSDPVGSAVQSRSVLQRTQPTVDADQFRKPSQSHSNIHGLAPTPANQSNNPLRQSDDSLSQPRLHAAQGGGERIETKSLGNSRSIGYRSYRQEDMDGSMDQGNMAQDGSERAAMKSCDDLRAELLNNPITAIEMNISPDRRRVKPVDDQLTRTWTDEFGNVLAKGTFLRLVHGYAIIETADGERHVPFQRLSENDTAIITSYWEMPRICRLGGGQYDGRYWVCQTVTWKASALCHKPLYFEDIQLERYGHSAGPLRQPIRSTAHFFTRLMTMPYQGGIHPPNECVYALGYYRPGDCAPWLVDPIPISLRGAARQSASALGAAFIYP